MRPDRGAKAPQSSSHQRGVNHIPVGMAGLGRLRFLEESP